MIPVPQTIDDWTALVESRTPFTYANIGGDGEMLTVTGWTGTNSDGKKSTPEKQKALARCLTEPRYTYAGYNPGRTGSPKLHRAENWLRKQGINVPHKEPGHLTDPEYGKAEINVRWVHKEIMSSANVRGQWGGFLRALRGRNWLAVHSDNCDDATLRKLGADVAFIVPKTWGWQDMDQIEEAVRGLVAGAEVPPLVTWGLGYLTKVLMWRLIPDLPDVTLIDLGASLDPYCGVRNRSGYRKDTWPAAMRKNLRGLA